MIDVKNQTGAVTALKEWMLERMPPESIRGFLKLPKSAQAYLAQNTPMSKLDSSPDLRRKLDGWIVRMAGAMDAAAISKAKPSLADHLKAMYPAEEVTAAFDGVYASTKAEIAKQYAATKDVRQFDPMAELLKAKARQVSMVEWLEKNSPADVEAFKKLPEPIRKELERRDKSLPFSSPLVSLHNAQEMVEKIRNLTKPTEIVKGTAEYQNANFLKKAMLLGRAAFRGRDAFQEIEYANLPVFLQAELWSGVSQAVRDKQGRWATRTASDFIESTTDNFKYIKSEEFKGLDAKDKLQFMTEHFSRLNNSPLHHFENFGQVYVQGDSVARAEAMKILETEEPELALEKLHSMVGFGQKYDKSFNGKYRQQYANEPLAEKDILYDEAISQMPKDWRQYFKTQQRNDIFFTPGEEVKLALMELRDMTREERVTRSLYAKAGLEMPKSAERESASELQPQQVERPIIQGYKTLEELHSQKSERPVMSERVYTETEVRAPEGMDFSDLPFTEINPVKEESVAVKTEAGSTEVLPKSGFDPNDCDEVEVTPDILMGTVLEDDPEEIPYTQIPEEKAGANNGSQKQKEPEEAQTRSFHR